MRGNAIYLQTVMNIRECTAKLDNLYRLNREMCARKCTILTNCDEHTRVYQLDNLYRLKREMCVRKYNILTYCDEQTRAFKAVR